MSGLLLARRTVLRPRAATGPSGPAAFGTTLAYHWKAGDLALADGAAVSSWPAAAGSAALAQATGSRQPTLASFTNNDKTFKGVVFSGAQFLQAASVAMPNPATVYYVVRDRQSATTDGVVQDYTGSTGRQFVASTNGNWRGYANSSVIGPAAVLGGWQVIIVGFSPGAGFFRLSGTKTGGINFGSAALAGMTVGADYTAGRLFSGDIAEIGYLTGLPSDTDLIRNIDSYVQDTYGIAVADYDPTWADNPVVDPGGGSGGPSTLYVAGGEAGLFTGTNSASSYDPTTDTWTALPAFSGARTETAGCCDTTGRLYVVGGNTTNWTNTVQRYDPAGGAWSAVASMTTFRGRHACAVDSQGRIYAVGGYTGQVTDVVERFDPATGAWSTLASLPAARQWLGAAADSQGRIYAVGGDTGGSGHVATVYRFDSATGAWSTLASMGTARFGHIVTAGADGKIYVAGGNDPAIAAAEVYDPATDVWSSIASMPTARFRGMGLADSSGYIYALGGESALESGAAITAVHRYDPTTNTWSSVAAMPVGRRGFAAGNSPVVPTFA